MAEPTARDDWAALDRQARREVKRNARRLRPHPDPAVAATAARYARAALDRTSRKILIIRLAAPAVAYLILVKVLTSLGVSGTAGGVDIVVMVVAFGACAALMVHAWLGLRRYRLLNRITMANWLAPGATRATPPAAAGPGPAGEENLSVRYVPRKVAAPLALWSAITLAAAGFWAFETASWHGTARTVVIVLLVVTVTGFAWTLAAQAWTLVRWALPGRPVADLDSGGVRLHTVGVRVPWTAVSEIGLFSVRAALGRRPLTIVGFRCPDPAAVLEGARPDWPRRRMMRRSERVYGTPFTISVALTDQSPEAIASAAAAFAGLPVRRR